MHVRAATPSIVIRIHADTVFLSPVYAACVSVVVIRCACLFSIRTTVLTTVWRTKSAPHARTQRYGDYCVLSLHGRLCGECDTPNLPHIKWPVQIDFVSLMHSCLIVYAISGQSFVLRKRVTPL